MCKFNEKAFNAIKVLFDDDESTDLQGILTVLNQASDASRLAKLNHNCIISDLPFGWTYYKNYGETMIKVVTFPMIKQSTGFRFYLDIEEDGDVYISEGKNTNRTYLMPSNLNAFSPRTQRMIATVLESIVNGRSKSDLFDLYKKFLSADYSFICGMNSDKVLNHYKFGRFETDIEESHVFESATPVVAISKDNTGNRGVDVLKSGGRYSYQYMEGYFCRYQITKTSDGWVIDDDVEDDNKQYIESALKKMNESELDSDKAYFIQDDLICQKWSEITIRPEIFVEHKDCDYVYYNDVVEIELNPQSDSMEYMMNGSEPVRFLYSVNDDLEGVEEED